MEKIKVRIAVSIDENGEWYSCGSSKENDKESMTASMEDLEGRINCFYIEAEVPPPKPKIIQGKVISAGKVDYGYKPQL